MKKMTPVEVREAFAKGATTIGPVAMPNDHYQSMIDFASSSSLKKMEKSPAKFRWEQDHPRSPTAAMLLGTAIHCALLEPDLFEETYRVRREKPKEPERPPELADVTRRSAEGKAKLEAWEATWRPKFEEELKAWETEKACKTFVSQDDMDILCRVHQRAFDHPDFSQYFAKGVGLREANFFARDPETGMPLRGRCDIYIPETHTVVDLKTTDSAEEHVFKSDIFKLGYNIQGAFYTDLLTLIYGKPPAFKIIAAEKTRDCDMREFILDDEVIADARARYREWLVALNRCMRTNEWMGYPRMPVSVALPAWLKGSSAAFVEEDLW